jgi:hypothetical protein
MSLKLCIFLNFTAYDVLETGYYIPSYIACSYGAAAGYAEYFRNLPSGNRESSCKYHCNDVFGISCKVTKNFPIQPKLIAERAEADCERTVVADEKLIVSHLAVVIEYLPLKCSHVSAVK